MRRLTLLLCCLVANFAAAADPAPTSRQPRFVATGARQIIVEAESQGRTWFERCDWLPEHDRSLADQLASSTFDHCVTLGAAVPTAARAGLERALAEAMAERRGELGDPSVARWALDGLVQGGLFGGVVAIATRRLVRRGTLTAAAAARDFVRYGGLFGVATGASQARSALKRQGSNQRVLGVFDAEMPRPVYVLDQRTDDPVLQARAIDLVAGVLDHVTRTYVP